MSVACKGALQYRLPQVTTSRDPVPSFSASEKFPEAIAVPTKHGSNDATTAQLPVFPPSYRCLILNDTPLRGHHLPEERSVPPPRNMRLYVSARILDELHLPTSFCLTLHSSSNDHYDYPPRVQEDPKPPQQPAGVVTGPRLGLAPSANSHHKHHGSGSKLLVDDRATDEE